MNLRQILAMALESDWSDEELFENVEREATSEPLTEQQIKKMNEALERIEAVVIEEIRK